MQKSGMIIIGSGVLIIIGLFLLVLGNQAILEGIVQENGKVSSEQVLSIDNNFDPQTTPIGVFAVQIGDFQENTFSAKIVDPLGIEITSQQINDETIEEEFEVLETGIYKLIIQSNSNEESQVFGAIGSLPDSGKKVLGFIPVYVIVAGMIGLVVVGILGIRNRKRSV
ncbi:hypothetical protein [Nitrosopumilus adriaticus]|uniref:Uncharacterized protein n=1 Tax=Nitrosopumilus adriaticus TaxID=1580092 RepID=A0A0D5C458_9ARCH|nr:hypothetical protein [Nitrosopumilus adriaticus]AJW71599.1 conserved exported protein of unknown function [Nitrosopumilus adriaticus]